MSLDNTKSGPQSASDFIVPGLPWLTSSIASTTPTKLEFPKVTRGITVRNLGSPTLWVGVTQNGVTSTGSCRFGIPSGASERFEIRSRVLFLQAESSTIQYSVCAELTLVDSNQMPYLTGGAVDPTNPGSGWPSGVG